MLPSADSCPNVNDTIDSENHTINSDNHTINSDNHTIDSDNHTIDSDTSSPSVVSNPSCINDTNDGEDVDNDTLLHRAIQEGNHAFQFGNKTSTNNQYQRKIKNYKVRIGYLIY